MLYRAYFCRLPSLAQENKQVVSKQSGMKNNTLRPLFDIILIQYRYIIIFRPHKWGRKIMICVAFFSTNSAKSPRFIYSI